MLKAVPSHRQPWDQLPGESDSDYASFAGWLLSSPRRPPLGQLPGAWDWAERAQAFDRWTSSPKRPEEKLSRVAQSLIEIVDVEVEKLRRLVWQATDRVLSTKDLVTVLALLQDNKELFDRLTAGDVDVDYSQFSESELKSLITATRKVVG